MPPSVFRTKNNRGRRFIFGEIGRWVFFDTLWSFVDSTKTAARKLFGLIFRALCENFSPRSPQARSSDPTSKKVCDRVTVTMVETVPLRECFETFSI